MLTFKNGSWWHRGRLLPQPQFDSRDFYKAAFRLLIEANPGSPVLNIAVSCFGLTKSGTLQLGLFENTDKKRNLVVAVDTVNERWGGFTVGSARSFGGAKMVMDRIAFGGIKELEESSLNAG
jgi:hypothetical protein